ncbi:MAG TPA: hypothetical protein VNJ51_02155 [Candidatus Dormibacteraeota bacterium]|nr:hypothetical protein [Candidatus Dormibacteraeota bacterium]
MSAAYRRQPPWIPPGALVLGQLSHGLSWVLLFALALRGATRPSPQGLAWIHLVALGWLTMVALAVLIFAAPNFTDVPLRNERLARVALYPYAAGVYLMVGGFWTSRFVVTAWGTAVVAASIVAYLIPMLRTLGRAAAAAARAEAAIARAIAGVLLMLAAAAGLGVAMAWALEGGIFPELLERGPAVHAALAGIGWLTILVFGVSVQTLGPIAGRRPTQRWRHVAVGIATLAGVLALAGGLALALLPLAWAGGALVAAAVTLYIIDVSDVLNHAANPHRPPQAFLAAAVAWLAAAAVLGLGLLAGAPWQSAYAYAGLMGWLGQMVNGHLHHIPVRLMATMVRGDHDETPPAQVLSAPLSWLAWGLSQLAVATGIVALLAARPEILAAAALCGLGGWCAMAANAVVAYRNLQTPRRTLTLL